ncbi:MAG: hypothetical protein AB1442_14155 [Nitrospirota bacterium]
MKISAASSIIGAVLSLYVLIELKRLNKRYLLKARIPEILNQLEFITADISKALKSFDAEKRTIETNIYRFEAAIENLKDKLHGQNKSAAVKLAKNIKKHRNSLDKDGAWELYNEFQSMINTVKHLQSDMKWGP